MSVFDHVYYPFHHNHINTPPPRKHPPDNPLWTSDGWGGVAWKLGGVITPPGGGLDKSLDQLVDAKSQQNRYIYNINTDMYAAAVAQWLRRRTCDRIPLSPTAVACGIRNGIRPTLFECIRKGTFWKKERKKFISSRQVQYEHTKSIQTPNIDNCLQEAARELL